MKKRCNMVSEDNAPQPVRCDSTLQIAVAIWQFELARLGPLQIVMAVWCTSNWKKSMPKGHYYPQRNFTSYQIIQQNCLQRAGGP